MELQEFLRVCRDKNLTICDRKGRKLVYGSKYADVADYLYAEVLDISTRDCNHIWVTIDFDSEPVGWENETKST